MQEPRWGAVGGVGSRAGTRLIRAMGSGTHMGRCCRNAAKFVGRHGCAPSVLRRGGGCDSTDPAHLSIQNPHPFTHPPYLAVQFHLECADVAPLLQAASGHAVAVVQRGADEHQQWPQVTGHAGAHAVMAERGEPACGEESEGEGGLELQPQVIGGAGAQAHSGGGVRGTCGGMQEVGKESKGVEVGGRRGGGQQHVRSYLGCRGPSSRKVPLLFAAVLPHMYRIYRIYPTALPTWTATA